MEDNVGLPMRLELPPEAIPDQDLDLIRPQLTGASATWSTAFTYPGAFDDLVASFDKQLKVQGYLRLVGPKHDIGVNFKPGDRFKPMSADGRKAWISKDLRTVLLLHYIFRRAKKDQLEVDDYQLVVLKTNDPNNIKPPDKIVPIR